MRPAAHPNVRRVALALSGAAMFLASASGAVGRAAPGTIGLPLLVSVSNKPPVFVDAEIEKGPLRVSRSDGRLPGPNDFSATFASGDFNRGGRLLAESEGRVVVYAPLTGELSMFDVGSGKLSVLLRGGILPTGLQDLELSARGIAAIVGGGETTRLVVVRIPTQSEPRLGWTEVRLPIEVTDTAFSTEGLLVLSSKDRALYEIPASELPLLRATPGEPKLTKLLTELPESPTAVAEWREILYVSLGRDLLVIPREMRQQTEVVAIPGPLEQTDRLRVSGQYLLALDAARERLAVVHRPVPVAVSFQGNTADTSERLVRLFDYLARYRLLPTKMIPVDRPNAFELMVVNDVLPPNRDAAPSPAVHKALEAVLCRLNPSLCEPLRLEPGAQLRVPDVPLNQRPLTTRVDLGEGTIADLLNARLFPEDRPSDTELLRRLLGANRQLDQTLDAQLFRLNFIPWQIGSERALRPGVPLALNKDGTFEIVSNVPACATDRQRRSLPKQSTGLGAVLRTQRVDHLKSLLGVTGTIDVGLGETEILAASPDSLKACALRGTAATHVATEVLVTDRIFVRARDANASVQYPDPEALRVAAAVQPAITGTLRPEWSATLEGPVAIGFRAQPIDPDVARAPVPLKSILNVQGGVFNLLVTGWEPLVVVQSKDLTSGSVLKSIESARDPLVRISSLERSPSRATASSVESSPADNKPLNDTERREAGERLRALIRYPAAPPDASSVVIVVAEKSNSVDRHHPDFRRPDGLSIWSKKTADGRNVELDTFPKSTGAPPAMEHDFTIEKDHGTHVAGLLAGLGLPPGLAPQAGLFLVAIEAKADQIRSELEFAADSIPASIANFSQVIPIDPVIQEQIGGGVDALADRLLVVAAVDNKQRSLTGTLLLAPIGWSDGPNVIGVAAADKNRKILKSSDTGKRYVQLLAFGEDVLSLADKGAYARTSGASQAAPQVAAAAALLAAAGQKDPVQVKTRLVATADWDDDYENKVWAGFLNVERAVSNLLSDVLVRTNLPNKMSVALHTNVRLQLKRSTEYASDSPTSSHEKSDGEIEWSKILRIVKQTWDSSSKKDAYRVVYVGSGNQVSILKNVEFKPNQVLPLKLCVRLDGQTPGPGECAPLDPTQIDDYVAKFPGMKSLRFVRR